MAKKSEPKPKTENGHTVQVEEYHSTMLNMKLYQPYCSCGWETARWARQENAVALAKKHLAESK
jgi:hypothetical protein